MSSLQINTCEYLLFPSYGPKFQDMSDYRRYWGRLGAVESDDLTGKNSIRFWPGFAGGGIVAINDSLFQRVEPGKFYFTPDERDIFSRKLIYGLVLGNESGEKIKTKIICAVPPRAPDFAVRLGLAPRIPEPTVCATMEHSDCLGDQRLLMVVPREGRRSLKMLDEIPTWYAGFGVQANQLEGELNLPFQREIRNWFDNPDRLKFFFSLSGGENDASWQLAVTYYIAEYWDTHIKGLQNVHFVADIETRPNFRQFWTSNR